MMRYKVMSSKARKDANSKVNKRKMPTSEDSYPITSLSAFETVDGLCAILRCFATHGTEAYSLLSHELQHEFEGVSYEKLFAIFEDLKVHALTQAIDLSDQLLRTQLPNGVIPEVDRAKFAELHEELRPHFIRLFSRELPGQPILSEPTAAMLNVLRSMSTPQRQLHSDWAAEGLRILVQNRDSIRKAVDLYKLMRQAGFPGARSAMYKLPKLMEAFRALKACTDKATRSSPRRGFRTTDGGVDAFET